MTVQSTTGQLCKCQPPAAVVIGATNMDVLAVANTLATAGDSTPGTTSFSAGGVGRNIAEGLTRLSVKTQLFSAVGQDLTGERLLSQCQELGIDCENILSIAAQSTSSYVAIHDVDGSLISAVNAMSIIDQLTVDRLPALPQCLRDADICVVDANLGPAFFTDLSQLAFSCQLAADAVSSAKCRRLLPLLSRLSLLKVNRTEAVELSGCHPDDADDHLLQQLLQRGCRQVLMTLGERGAMMATANAVAYSAAAAVTTIETVNGAGDSLFAGVIAAMLRNLDLDEQLRWGTAAAALSLQTTAACSPLLSLQQLQGN